MDSLFFIKIPDGEKFHIGDSQAVDFTFWTASFYF